MNKFIIRCIMFFRPVYKKFGIHTAHLEAILTTKLMMDDRRPIFMSAMKGKKSGKKNTSLAAMAFMFFMGLVFINTLFMKQPYLGHTIYFTFFMIMLILTLVNDFSQVLIDVRDNTIILTRPVDDLTFAVSRIIHIGIHIFKLVLAFTLPGSVYVFIADGWMVGFVFLLQVFTASTLSLLMVNIVYIGLLRMNNPQRFKDIIAYFQVAFAAVLFIGYQFVPRLFSLSELSDYHLLNNKWFMVLPSVWIAALHEWAILLPIGDVQLYSLAILAIVSPLFSLYFVKLLAPGFNQKLMAMSGSGSENKKVASSKGYGINFLGKVAGWFTADPIENAGFRLTWLLSGRFREFKVKVYPSFAFVPIYFIYIVFFMDFGKSSFSEKLVNFSNTNNYVTLAYLTSFIMMIVLSHVGYTDKYKASWVYFSAPFSNPGKIFSGMFKALFVKYFMPMFLLVSIFCIWIFGLVVVNDLFLALVFIFLYGLMIAAKVVDTLPFSKPVPIKASSKFMAGIVIFMVPLSMGFIHYWIARWEMLVTLLAIIFAVIAYFAFKAYQRMKWDKLELVD